MPNNKIVITDAITGETIERPMTDEEQAAHNAVIVSAKTEQDEKAIKKAAAEAKLAALGLTADDLQALGLGGN